MDRVSGFEARTLPDSALNPVPVLLGGKRLAEAAAIAVVGDPCIDAKHKGGLAAKPFGEVNIDRCPAVAMNSHRYLID